jgi:hypothetical protein
MQNTNYNRGIPNLFEKNKYNPQITQLNTDYNSGNT